MLLRGRHQRSLCMGRSVFITIIITYAIDITPLTVCVDWNPKLSLLNPMHVCGWEFEIILW
jgi:hypothetical protein